VWYDFDTYVAYSGANSVNVSVDINKVCIVEFGFMLSPVT